jgi:hypothetical protein
MRANTITNTRPKPKAWRPILALVLAVCALAIPGSASAVPIDSDSYSSVDAITGGSDQSSQPTIARPNEGIVSPDHLHYAGPPLSDTSQPVASSDGFDWLSAAIGAGTAMALVTLGGALFLTVRRRTAVSPSAASMS